MSLIPICFLSINTPVDLSLISIGSCLSATDNEIFVGFTDLTDVKSFPDNPRIKLIDLGADADKLGISKGSYKDFSQEEFFQLVQLKWILISKVMNISDSKYVQYCDLDVLWISNPSNYIVETFNKHPLAEILIQDASTDPSLPDLCMGYCAFRNSASTKQMLSELQLLHERLLGTNPFLGDDDVVTEYYRNSRDLRIIRLPQVTFPVGNMGLLYSGKSYFPGVKAPTPYIFHANFVIGARRKVEYLLMLRKRYRLKVDGITGLRFRQYGVTRILRVIKFRVLAVLHVCRNSEPLI